MPEYLDLFKNIIALIVTGALSFLAYEVHKARESVVELNTKIAVILTRLEFHTHEIDSHEERIVKLEERKHGVG